MVQNDGKAENTPVLGNKPVLGVLFESDEWSDYKLASELRRALAERGCDADVALIDMQRPDALAKALSCQMLASRVFASARFRNHDDALEQMDQLVGMLESGGSCNAAVPMVNPPCAHAFETSKLAATEALAAIGIDTPKIFACGDPSAIDPESLTYPCIAKPDCGGRSTDTAILHSPEEARTFFDRVPTALLMVQEYIEPERGFVTRIEIVGSHAALVVKRSIAPSGLSGYHEGSAYAPYGPVPPDLEAAALRAAKALGFVVGSFDVIEASRGRFFIDANSVSNVSEDCTGLLGCDLMALHADAIADLFVEAVGSPD